MASKIKVLVVDDSALVRRILTDRLGRDPRIEVVGTASDAYEARDKIVLLEPEVLTLDLEMPRMSGLEFIGVLMQHRPMPIIVVSGQLDRDPSLSIKALDAGAVEVFPKPSSMDDDAFKELCNLIVSAKKINFKTKPKLGSAALLSPKVSSLGSNRVIVIGASTGGTEAIKEVLTRLPAGMPGIVMVQHMPAGFTTSFAERLDSLCPHLQVKEAKDGDEVRPGLALLAPGSYQMYLRRKAGGYYVEVKDGELVNRHKPSVDVIFNSAAAIAGSAAVGVILTGMGADGAKGLLAMRQAGARTIAQDEASCVVFGMPREAIALGGAEKVVSLEKVAEAVTQFL
ncbi:MAG: chemotaxis response regulator protein-glutamate methylesterase [Candidatus Lambdaproteobacteria bacterium RIFOXYD1_FULL_56_27]|uniref:Protein-glutamate methylesterase/protein-glutamine glutaminase n=1 Tax=Candidatus Lambdaproteobacteria bacterium RIFOXYD2_FULL_56_26 TaxID=1817773 RepID=A0A1F6GLC8_9PROT|nr:MAG: chemotaxis response regulator protein-glutamate methylesterase [Candidatus Lambdaproteobacteria bacterium RIFOXYD2_FULL_56_26]OGH05481.1 MAG: chemotaxis response regulator protein-glutamate methylesterase [Candidatus Lambdaproteobacteria bacterium RIFOXYC1_FULL_56_13]OGH09772.1 MAG: chemotaxis response regulator protein-glutamate methylesterase [Candidatus Lambdaproteobacteria bacterium RIFOXYD1_FULL_56_27]